MPIIFPSPFNSVLVSLFSRPYPDYPRVHGFPVVTYHTPLWYLAILICAFIFVKEKFNSIFPLPCLHTESIERGF